MINTSTWITLPSVLDFPSVVHTTRDSAPVLSKDGKGLVRMPHACTVLFDWDKLQDERWALSSARTLEITEDIALRSPVFLAPSTWRLAHVVHALGAFKSVGEAKRNGWDKDVAEGLDFYSVRFAHVKYVFTVYRVPAALCAASTWESI